MSLLSQAFLYAGLGAAGSVLVTVLLGVWPSGGFEVMAANGVAAGLLLAAGVWQVAHELGRIADKIGGGE